MARKRKPGVPAKQPVLKRIVPLPDAIQVGAHLIPILRENLDTRPETNEMFGYFSMDEKELEICLDNRLQNERELTVFFHEVLHAISETYGLGLKHKQVYGVSEGLTQALTPWLSALYHKEQK